MHEGVPSNPTIKLLHARGSTYASTVLYFCSGLMRYYFIAQLVHKVCMYFHVIHIDYLNYEWPYIFMLILLIGAGLIISSAASSPTFSPTCSFPIFCLHCCSVD